ncbi:MAG: hypothetical protein AABZ31_02315 [Bdellovibrionota bacterium]
MTYDIRILQSSDLDAVLQFERARLKASATHEESNASEMASFEIDMLEWHAPWRKEALEHYLPQGWSFSLWSESGASGQLQAYFLAQPQVFTRGLTQTLWMEQLSATTQAQSDQLLEIAYKLCREKHFQKLIIRPAATDEGLSTGLPLKLEKHQDNLFEIKTSRI